MIVWAFLGALAITTAGHSETQTVYREGQVWEYRARPEDNGSLLRIQKIETDPVFKKYGPIYHISVIGVRFNGIPLSGELAHLPVSRQTLDASVTRQSTASVTFPDAAPGIAEWRLAKGGVFTIPLSEIIGAVEQMFRQGSDPKARDPELPISIHNSRGSTPQNLVNQLA
jgi:hypothetical protein